MASSHEYKRMNFEIISEITEVKTIFVGNRIRDLAAQKDVWKRAMAKGKRSGDSASAKW